MPPGVPGVSREGEFPDGGHSVPVALPDHADRDKLFDAELRHLKRDYRGVESAAEGKADQPIGDQRLLDGRLDQCAQSSSTDRIGLRDWRPCLGAKSCGPPLFEQYPFPWLNRFDVLEERSTVHHAAEQQELGHCLQTNPRWPEHSQQGWDFRRQRDSRAVASQVQRFDAQGVSLREWSRLVSGGLEHTYRPAGYRVARDGHGFVQPAQGDPASSIGVDFTVVREEFRGSQMFRRPGERDLIAWLATIRSRHMATAARRSPATPWPPGPRWSKCCIPVRASWSAPTITAASWTSETPTTPHIRSDGLADGDCLCHVQSGGGSLREPCVIDQVQAAVIHLGRGDQRDHVVVIEALLPASPAVPLDE